MKKDVATRTMKMVDGSSYEAPDAPIVFKVYKRNDDGTWSVEVPDVK